MQSKRYFFFMCRKSVAVALCAATLFLSAIIGGSIGAIAGMYLFHHKTRHWYFVIGMPAILVAQIAAWVLLFR